MGLGQVTGLEAFKVRRLPLPERIMLDSDWTAMDFEHVHGNLAGYQKMRRPN